MPSARPLIRNTPDTSWTVRLADAPTEIQVPSGVGGRSVPATVPGCVHTDLLAAGLIEDPYVDQNESSTHWIGECDWWYETVFTLDDSALAHDRLDLCFEGLDTAAEVFLNDQSIGRAENMHLRYRFDAKRWATAGDNRLAIRFASPVRYALEMEQRVGPRPGIGAGANPRQLPHHMIRKMACNFGWDWGPQLPTSGIWRPWAVEAWSHARLGDIRPAVTRADESNAHLRISVGGESQEATETSPSSGLRLRAVLSGPAGGVVAEQIADWRADGCLFEMDIDDPERWWPRGYGKQPRYTLEVYLLDASGQQIDYRSHRVGLRTSELRIAPDSSASSEDDRKNLPGGLTTGESFTLVINDQPVFCKGANWIPDDCFPHRVTPERYRERIEQAAEANMNMLRVWGGGLYEDHAFFETCDELGVLVWQDFLFACACYPEEQPLWDLVEAEARDNVARLSRHPSLVLWNGCNENIWGTFDWPAFGDIRTAGKETWGLGYYLDLLPRVIEDLAATTPYWPGSPFSGSMDRHPNANEYGNRHIWDVWNGHGNYHNYLTHFPRFASEFGFQGPPTWPTIEASIPKAQRQWLSDASRHHNKQIDGQQRALDRIADAFDVPDDFDDQWFLASVNQARALTMGCEWFRAMSPWCSGTLYWQLNDCWPVTSWAAVDGQGRPKLAWYATQRFFRPRLLTLMPDAVVESRGVPQALAAYLHNDHEQSWRDRLTISACDLTGGTVDEFTADIDVPARSVQRVDLPSSWFPEMLNRSDRVVFAQTARGEIQDRAWWFPEFDRDIAYPSPRFTTRLERDSAGGQTLYVKSQGLVRELCLQIDRLDPEARVDTQLWNLLPGESAVFRISSMHRYLEDTLADPTILRSVNHLVDPAPTALFRDAVTSR
ncbi:MAG: sugar-binding domain-containing protein [Planctomycetota bacterium]